MSWFANSQDSPLDMQNPTFPDLVQALRDADQDAFTARVQHADRRLLETKNETPYAPWFGGVGATLLQLTAFVRPDFASVLLDAGVDLDLHSAAALGKSEVVARQLRERPEAIEHQVDGFFPIQFATRHADTLRTFLQSGDDANRPLKKVAWFDWEDGAVERGISDWRLIHMVAFGRGTGRHEDVAEVLRDAGAELNPSSLPLGNTPIHLAATYDRSSIIRWFVSQEIDVDARTEASTSQEELAELFVTDPFAPFTGCKQTSLMLAIGEGHSGAVSTLLDLGADVNAHDASGFSPLHYAAAPFWQEDVTTVRRLLQCGARPDHAASDGRTPLDLAVANGHEATVAALSG